MNNFNKRRYYLHGDKSEVFPSKYYCALCDSFELKEHFYSNTYHKVNNQDKYIGSLNSYNKASKDFLKFNIRPAEVENLFSNRGKGKDEL